MSEERMNKHPEFLQETMFAEHGTKVLITNPKADQYLDMHAKQMHEVKREQERYRQWTEEADDPTSK